MAKVPSSDGPCCLMGGACDYWPFDRARTGHEAFTAFSPQKRASRTRSKQGTPRHTRYIRVRCSNARRARRVRVILVHNHRAAIRSLLSGTFR